MGMFSTTNAVALVLVCACANAQTGSSYADVSYPDVSLSQDATDPYYSYQEEGEQTSQEVNVGPVADGDDDTTVYVDGDDDFVDSYAMGDDFVDSYGSGFGSGDSYDSGSFDKDDDAPIYDDFGVDIPGRYIPSPEFEEIFAPSCDDDDGCNSIPTLNIGPAFTYGKAKTEEAFMPSGSIVGLGFGAAAVFAVAAVATVGYRRRAAAPASVGQAQDLLPFDMV